MKKYKNYAAMKIAQATDPYKVYRFATILTYCTYIDWTEWNW